MKITLNALQYKHNSSGIGQFIYYMYSSLISEMEKGQRSTTVDIITSKDSPPILPRKFDFTSVIEASIKKSDYVRRNLYELALLGRDIDSKTDVYVSLDGKLPLFFPSSPRKVLGITDMAVYRMGEVYQASRTLYWKPLFKHSIKAADKIIAISQFTKNEIIDITGINPEKVDVIYCGVGKSFKVIEDSGWLSNIRNKYGLPETFILFVGTFSPRKNLLRLIKAFEILKDRYDVPHKLVIVGEKGWKFNKETSLIQKSKISESIIFPGYVSDMDLSAVYNLADLTVYPSVYEGFGLPVIESMACGTPVALSESSCLPEIAGEAGIYFDPYNIEDMADKIYNLLSDKLLYEYKKGLGSEQAAKYSWDKAARELLILLDSLCH